MYDKAEVIGIELIVNGEIVAELNMNGEKTGEKQGNNLVKG